MKGSSDKTWGGEVLGNGREGGVTGLLMFGWGDREERDRGGRGKRREWAPAAVNLSGVRRGRAGQGGVGKLQ